MPVVTYLHAIHYIKYNVICFTYQWCKVRPVAIVLHSLYCYGRHIVYILCMLSLSVPFLFPFLSLLLEVVTLKTS